MTDNEVTDCEDTQKDNGINDCDDSYKEHGNFGRKTSHVWKYFTVIDRDNQVALCRICDRELSYKTTITNLRKHVERKHRTNDPYFQTSSHQKLARKTVSKPQKRIYTSYRAASEPRQIRQIDARKSKISDLGGLEGLVLNIIGEDGETDTIIADHEANQEIYTEEVHELSASENNQEENFGSKEQRGNRQQQPNITDPSERRKRNRIMDLQLECLEVKKYNMQLETLMLEQQLNIRRSIFTETLHRADTQSRGIQTDVGGENIKVFYLADGKGGAPRRHLFTMQDLE